MRLSFSSNEYLNTVIRDEDGRQLYSISSPGFLRCKTTITKHGPQGDDDVIGIITWHLFRDAKIWLKATGVEVEGNSLLKLKWFSSSRTFTGPDGKEYSWNLETTNCRLKEKGSGVEVAKYHQRNFGIMSPSHAPYLEISPSVSHMLDYIVITFVYAEKSSADAESAAAGA
ncbi:hypothetical protein PISMIDRAFT_684802 [Pisolithus microcarpus 441]|uniref:Unplaced genomic scaffold scaffold_133, whole genome shotgun sequence n=1 Tax=Pisolithus microcarpus 441 TaxID=765257 RepID=A0A0C9YM78_9AGAM|nr:hypothetical protein BKA83DRAFT_684802 [Pisolithus microcarpus]KIK17856.1 hypothetical protein PISMIDRAFT_684802 [Pisolithus microcarpus 441]